MHIHRMVSIMTKGVVWIGMSLSLLIVDAMESYVSLNGTLW